MLNMELQGLCNRNFHLSATTIAITFSKKQDANIHRIFLTLLKYQFLN